MNRSDIQENLFGLYLRLNGYFVSGFIAHASHGNMTEIDNLAVRFPYHQEPERELNTSPVLETSDTHLDFLVCEVKGGAKNINFNSAFRDNPEAIKKVLFRIGAFTEEEVSNLVPKIKDLLCPASIRRLREFPSIEIPRINSRLRFLLVVPEQKRKAIVQKPYIYGDDIISYIWACFRPTTSRQGCAVRYNLNLWGEQYVKLVEYFKGGDRSDPGDIENLYAYFGL